MIVSPALADDSDIFGKDIQPNVMLLFDTSSSMNGYIPSIPYDPNITYPVDVNTTVVYNLKKMKDTPTVYKSKIADVPDANARDALATVGFWVGKIKGSKVYLRLGNFINYWRCTTCSGLEKKIDAAKRVISDVIQNVDGVRFGVMRMRTKNGDPGGEIIAPIGTDKTTMINAVNSLVYESGTPLGEQLYDAGQYYKGKQLIRGQLFPSPIQYECQPNFVVLFTDGNQDYPMDARKEATNRRTEDHSSTFAGKQNVIVHAVAFGLAGDTAAIGTLTEVAKNGGGNFYEADNAAQLEMALLDAVNKIIAATFTFASPVIPTTSTTGSTRAYVASFQSDLIRPFWRGFLKAYQRDAVTGEVPIDPVTKVPLDSALIWDAGELLSQKLADARTIFTMVGGGQKDFVKSTSAISISDLNAADTAERDKIIDFIRGIDAFDEDFDADVTEERAWKLGDIFHSSPVLVSPPISSFADPTYDTFKATNAVRTTVLIAGANDGMLHAFRESDGEELWAFIPPDLLGGLKDLTEQATLHSFYVDSSPVAADICNNFKLDPPDDTGYCQSASNWKTIVVFGERRGGNYYHALDITDTTNPVYLWSFTDPKITETWSELAIGKVKMDNGFGKSVGKFVAFFGGGYDTAQNNDAGKAFFVVDLATGKKLWEYYNDGSLDDRQYMNFSFATSPTVADLDHDGYVDRVYIGDVGGQVWKFDLSARATTLAGLVTNWTGKRLFAADPSQPNPPAVGEYYPDQAIYAAPTLAFDDYGSLWVYFGTGDRNHPNNTSTNRFYGIKDNTTMANGSVLTEASLVDVTTTDATAIQGWFFTLGANEKVLAGADVFKQIVYFSTFTPAIATLCGGGGGDAKLYAIQMGTGYAAIDWASGDTLASTDSSKQRGTIVGSGIATKPIVVVTYDSSTSTITASVVTATTNEQLPNNPAPAPSSLKQVIYWREVF